MEMPGPSDKISSVRDKTQNKITPINARITSAREHRAARSNGGDSSDCTHSHAVGIGAENSPTTAPDHGQRYETLRDEKLSGNSMRQK